MSLIKKMGLGLQDIYQKTLQKLDSLKGNPKEIAKGFATGIAMSFTPFVGFHLLLCIIIAKITKQNGIAAALGTIAGNPWTFPLIWYLALHLGIIILGTDAPVQPVDFKILFARLFHAVISLDFSAFFSDIWPVFFPMLVGSVPLYIIVWWSAYLLTLHALWKGQPEGEKDDTGPGM